MPSVLTGNELIEVIGNSTTSSVTLKILAAAILENGGSGGGVTEEVVDAKILEAKADLVTREEFGVTASNVDGLEGRMNIVESQVGAKFTMPTNVVPTNGATLVFIDGNWMISNPEPI